MMILSFSSLVVAGVALDGLLLFIYKFVNYTLSYYSKCNKWELGWFGSILRVDGGIKIYREGLAASLTLFILECIRGRWSSKIRETPGRSIPFLCLIINRSLDSCCSQGTT